MTNNPVSGKDRQMRMSGSVYCICVLHVPFECMYSAMGVLKLINLRSRFDNVK